MTIDVESHSIPSIECVGHSILTGHHHHKINDAFNSFDKADKPTTTFNVLTVGDDLHIG